MDEIKGAYRALAVSLHPDKKGGDNERFSEVTFAYSTLSDSKRRMEYDAKLRLQGVCEACTGAGRTPIIKGFHTVGFARCKRCGGAGIGPAARN